MLSSIKHLFTLAAYVFGTLSAAPPTQALFPLGDSTYKDLITYGEGFEGVIGYLPSPIYRLEYGSSACSAVKIGETLFFGDKKDVYLTAAHCVRTKSIKEQGGTPDPQYLIASHPGFGKETCIPKPTEGGSIKVTICSLNLQKDLAVLFAPGTAKPAYSLYQGDFNDLKGHLATVVGYGQRYTTEPSFSFIFDAERPRQAGEIQIEYDAQKHIFFHIYKPVLPSWTKDQKQPPSALMTRGDSGGPLFVKDAQGKLVVIGVNARGGFNNGSFEEGGEKSLTCSRYGQATFFTKTMLERHLALEYHKMKRPNLHTMCTSMSLSDEYYEVFAFFCYDTINEWEPIDMDFIGPILKQFNVTTP